MKKRYYCLISFIFLMFLLFLFLASAADAEKWIECKSSCATNDNACPPFVTGNKCCISGEKLTVNSADNYCCSDGAIYRWQGPIPCCTDFDGDYYIVDSIDKSLCGDVCGPNYNAPCLGNKDCDDDNPDINPGISENTNALCSDAIDNNCNKNNDNSWDNDPNTGKDCQDLSCAGQPGPGGITCCQTASIVSNCLQKDCVDEKCISNVCNYDTKRIQCDTTECLPKYGAGYYCDGLGETCQTPDLSSEVCLYCAPDQTPATWSWDPPISHQDDGKYYASYLFDSDGLNCPASSCSDTTPGACLCYDTSGVLGSAKHKSALSTSTCCGDDTSEYYKPDYYGPECTNNVNDCVWSDGNAQDHNTGNKEYWCYFHEWYECKVNTDIGKIVGSMRCAGTAENKKWIPNSQVPPENSYSCTDSIDNDADGKIDCTDSDCAGLSGPGSVTCCQTATVTSNCLQKDCVDEKCISNVCNYNTKRNQCDTTECLPKYGAGYYCDALGGNCQTPDASKSVCENCFDSYGGDKTIGEWTATVHEDKGIGWSSNTDVYTTLFNSDGGSCIENDGTECYNNIGTIKYHESASPSVLVGACCGDDAGEFYKYNHYGGECVDDVNECVWGSGGGDAQASNTGNEWFWCYQHEWKICKAADANTLPIGTKVGDIAGNNYVICAGTAGTQKWTPKSLVSRENLYSCTDGYDNDGDGKIDCQDTDCPLMDYYYQTGTESPTATESCYLRDYYCDVYIEKFTELIQYPCGTCAYISGESCTGSTRGSCSFYSSSTQGPTPDQWAGGGNTQTATCGIADNDAISEYRDYHCTGTSETETYSVTQTKNCNIFDGWSGGGNNAGCGTDPNSVWNDYYATLNTGDCASTTSCIGTGSVNCDSQDICTNKCEGTVFVSVPPMKDYYVVTNTNTCTSTTDNPVREDCTTKPSSDSDGSSTAYTTQGTVDDYTSCTLTGCAKTSYNDACSGTVLTEYGASGADKISSNYDCQILETNYCSNDRYYRNEWTCLGIPGACSADAPDTQIGTNADNDAKDKECGDNLCDNVAGVYDSTKPSTETSCADGIDNDCDGKKDGNQGSNSDPDCCSFTQSTETTCDGADNDCDGTIDEGCDDDNDNYCDSGMGISGTPPTCTAGGGDCDDNAVGINPAQAEICTNSVDDNCNVKTDCYDAACAGQTGPNSKTCCQRPEIDCVQNACVIESCSGINECSYANRNQCDATECPNTPEQQYCDAAGATGNCAAPDASSAVCLNCAPDQTAATWTWTPPNHQDKGIGWSANTEIRDTLFNSDGGTCIENDGTNCYDSNGAIVTHNLALPTENKNCCGDDDNEWYKYDYYGGECTNNVNDCVWGSGVTGDAQDSNTGNEKYWCYLHEWKICNAADANTLPIGTRVGDIAGNNYVTCAGTAGTQKWTISADLLPENLYSCTDGLDNDGDGKIDCADSDCAGTISGSVKDAGNIPIGSAKIDVLKNAVPVHTVFANALGVYTINDNQKVICGSYDMIASSSSYVSSTRTIQLQPNQPLQNIDFILTKGTTCEADCTYAGDELIHAECQDINNCDLCNFINCDFCEKTIAASSCNLAKIGWIKDYDDPNQPECLQTGCVVECGEGCPIAKIETKSSVTCDEENLIKVTKLVTYKGKLAKLVIVTCG